jgi:hypothetical protein
MFGRTVLSQNSVFPTRVSADGSPTYKAGGVTIDWSLVTAASGDVTLGDGSVIKDGQKYLRYGQIITMVTSTGKYGPYDPALTQGSELLTRGRCFIVDQTVLQYSSGSSALGAANDIIGGVFDGGAVWLDRIIQSGVASHTKTAGPTKAEFLAAFPLVQIVEDV